MIRKIIKIDEDRCNGCGLCTEACHEGAIRMVDGKAKLAFDHYCDGLGDCLPVCPTGAITFEEREAAAYDAEAVAQSQGHGQGHAVQGHRAGQEGAQSENAGARAGEPLCACAGSVSHKLGNWPVQIRLTSPGSPQLAGAHLLIAADCAAFACGDFHARFMGDRRLLIGCPKLDDVDYREKLAAIFDACSPASITVVRMEVPCCAGLARAAVDALASTGKDIPLKTVTLTLEGEVLED
ncbi:MAG: 4Fe-4S binding protein [Clostridiales Family XIII bacterium]|jgi:ferredoxin|nr:4Fe-4S binding protein [Clostridiales Family XIII bacterium]